MSISNSSSEANISSNWTVIWALRSWVSWCWPSIWLSVELIIACQKSVFLLDSVPWFLFLAFSKNHVCLVPEICFRWDQSLVSCVLPNESFSHNYDVISSSKWIWEVSDRLHDDFRVLSCCHVAWWTIEIPLWKLIKACDFFIESSSLWSDCEWAINPNIFSNNLSSLVKIVHLCVWCECLFRFHSKSSLSF